MSETNTLGSRQASQEYAGLQPRTRLMIDECREELTDLRQAAKTARSHREKCMKLLARASDAVVALEDVLYAQNLQGNEQEQIINRMAPRILSATDHAESLVKSYGCMGSMQKFYSKFSSAGSSVHEKFDECSSELSKLGSTIRQAIDSGPMALMATMPSSPKLPTVGSDMQGKSSGSGDGTDSTGAAMEPTVSGSRPSQDENISNQSSFVPPRNLYSSRAEMSEPTASGMLSMSPEFSQATHVMSIPKPTEQGIAQVSIASVPHKVIRKGSRQETFVTAEIVYGGQKLGTLDGGSGEDTMWMYCSRFLSADRFQSLGISSEVSRAITLDRVLGQVSVMHYDIRGVMWTGHKNGMVLPWQVSKQEAFCRPMKVSSGCITAIATDEAGTAWVGSEKGDVRRVSVMQQVVEGGGVLGFELVILGSLKHSGSGSPETSASHQVDENGMVVNHRAKEKAHNGPISSICAAAGRVWTSGGTPAFLCMREWTQRGEFMSKKDLKMTGAATAMKLVTPFVMVKSPSNNLGSAFSGGTETSMTTSEIPQSWQLLTGYANGTVGVWGAVNGVLCQLLRIGKHCPPVTGIAIFDELGTVCTSHLDGKLRIRVPPRLADTDKLQITYYDKTISTVNLQVTEVLTSDAG